MQPSPSNTLPRRSIFGKSRSDTKRMLRHHLLWHYYEESNFISWSSSILWVLEHAARMHIHEHKSNVHIAVMDTRKVDDMSLFPATALMTVFDMPDAHDANANKLRREYYSSEYLFYGPVRNGETHSLYRSVRWDVLCAVDLHNLLNVFSGRSASDRQLWLRIAEIRSRFATEDAAGTLNNAVPMFLLIGKLFGAEYEFVVTVALTTMLHGRKADTLAMKQLLKLLQVAEPRNPDSIDQYAYEVHIDRSLTEVFRMYSFMGLAMVRLSATGGNQDLAASIGDLAIGS